MKTLKNKIFAGTFALASLGLFGNKNLSAQTIKETITANSDSLKILRRVFKNGMIYIQGYKNELGEDGGVFIGCYDLDNNGDYEKRMVDKKHGKFFRSENFTIDFNTGNIDYAFTSQDYKNIVFQNLTIKQIYQDKEFAERTKRIINSCTCNDIKLRNIVEKEYEKDRIEIPKIKQ